MIWSAAKTIRWQPKKPASNPFNHISRNSSVRQALDAALPLQTDTLLEVDQLATVMGTVEAGLGVSVVPALTLFHFERQSLALRPMAIVDLTRTIYLVRSRQQESMSAAAQPLHDLNVLRMKGGSLGAEQTAPA